MLGWQTCYKILPWQPFLRFFTFPELQRKNTIQENPSSLEKHGWASSRKDFFSSREKTVGTLRYLHTIQTQNSFTLIIERQSWLRLQLQTLSQPVQHRECLREIHDCTKISPMLLLLLLLTQLQLNSTLTEVNLLFCNWFQPLPMWPL